jgi:hypothetical protein
VCSPAPRLPRPCRCAAARTSRPPAAAAGSSCRAPWLLVLASVPVLLVLTQLVLVLWVLAQLVLVLWVPAQLVLVLLGSLPWSGPWLVSWSGLEWAP